MSDRCHMQPVDEQPLVRGSRRCWHVPLVVLALILTGRYLRNMRSPSLDSHSRVFRGIVRNEERSAVQHAYVVVIPQPDAQLETPPIPAYTDESGFFRIQIRYSSPEARPTALIRIHKRGYELFEQKLESLTPHQIVLRRNKTEAAK